MADSLTPNIQATEQEIGGNNNTWGNILNDNFALLDNVLGDTVTINTTGGDVTLSDAQELVMIIRLTGTLASALNVVFTGRGGFWVISNETTGAHAVTCKLTGETGEIIVQGTRQLVYCDGTDIRLVNKPLAVVPELDVAAATTTNVLGAASDYVRITGSTVDIESLGTGPNTRKFVRFAGSVTLVHHATTLILQTAANIVTQAGDMAIVISDASSNARVWLARASGAPLVLGDGVLAGDATLSGALTLSSTGAIRLPGGTTAQRPGTPAERQFRYNTTAGRPEFFNGTSWIGLGVALGPPQGYLTLDADNPVILADQAAKTTVYYVPFVGNLIPLSDGSTFTMRAFAALSCDLVSNHLASTIYDVYAWDDDGTQRLVTSVAWNTSTAGAGARGTGTGTAELVRVQGLLTNAVSQTVRNGANTFTMDANEGLYLGSILIDGSAGQVTCHRAYGQSRKFGVWNAYNRRPIMLRAGDTTATWNYQTATTRPSNNDSNNAIAAFAGLPEEQVDASFLQFIHHAVVSGTSALRIGIGLNSTTTFGGTQAEGNLGYGSGTGTITMKGSIEARLIAGPGLGLNMIQALENGLGSAGNPTMHGGEEDMLLAARWMG